MEVKIGVAESPRELVVSSAQTPDEIEALVSDALKNPSGLLSLVFRNEIPAGVQVTAGTWTSTRVHVEGIIAESHRSRT